MAADAAPTVAVLGAHGFIGSNVTAAASAMEGWHVWPVHRGSPGGFDVRDASSVRAAIEGARVVVHAASYIGNDPTMCDEVNVKGTANVVAASKGEGVGRVVYVSTAAVYGRGPFHEAAEDELTANPTSTLSRSRAAAERFVLGAGGVVVRPHLVLGVGDRWVGPGLVRLARTLGGLPRYVLKARHSVIDVALLGRVIVALAVAEELEGQVFHAANRMPVTVGELSDLLSNDGSLFPRTEVADNTARRAGERDASIEHALALLGREHTFATRQIEQAARMDLGIRFAMTSSGESWYLAALA